MENKNSNLRLEKLYVSLGDYKNNIRVRFFIKDQASEYYEITNNGFIHYDGNYINDEFEHCWIPIGKLGIFENISNKISPMMSRITYVGGRVDPRQDLCESERIMTPLTTGICYNDAKVPVSVKNYLKRMAINAAKNKYIEIDKILECKEVLDKLCEKSYKKYLTDEKCLTDLEEPTR